MASVAETAEESKLSMKRSLSTRLDISVKTPDDFLTELSDPEEMPDPQEEKKSEIAVEPTPTG